jgi:thiol-disulfide isomerase/thioredoxin
MTGRFLAGLLALLMFAMPASAAGPAVFTADSLAQIKAQYAGRPFILGMWSASECGYCIDELTMLGRIARTHKSLPLVLVATDTPAQSAAIQQILAPLGLAGVDSWVFADTVPERLRRAIDPSWYGEIPRTYLYDAEHRRETVIGVLNEQRLRAWLKQHRITN